jgi:hypothetical protein
MITVRMQLTDLVMLAFQPASTHAGRVALPALRLGTSHSGQARDPEHSEDLTTFRGVCYLIDQDTGVFHSRHSAVRVFGGRTILWRPCILRYDL